MRYIAFALMLLAPQILQGQNTVPDSSVTKEVMFQYQGLVQDSRIQSQRGNVQAFTYVSDHVGLWGSAWVERHYVSGMLGSYADPITWDNGKNVIEVGLGIGAERDSAKAVHVRYAGDLTVGNDDNYVELYHENGTTHEGWSRIDANWQATPVLGLGIYGQTGDGVGPRLRVSVEKLRLRVWGMSALGSNKFLIGGELVFQKKE